MQPGPSLGMCRTGQTRVVRICRKDRIKCRLHLAKHRPGPLLVRCLQNPVPQRKQLERVACLLHTDSEDSMRCRSSMPKLAVLRRVLGLSSFRVHGTCSEKDELISDAATLESFQLLKVPFGPSNCILSIDTKGYRVAVT